MKKPLICFVDNFIVRGDGSSIWMDSKELKSTVTSFSIDIWNDEEEKDGFWGTVKVFGYDMPWEAYTDKAIEKQIFKFLKKYVKDYRINNFFWSEQGRQKDNMWDFDISVNPIYPSNKITITYDHAMDVMEGRKTFNPMEREIVIKETEWAGEGAFKSSDLEKMDDKELAHSLMSAWRMYAAGMN